MKKDDFRYMHQKKQLVNLKNEDLKLLEPIYNKGTKKERALLLLHGFSSTPAVYRYLIPKIKPYDTIICPILPGHAESIEAFSHSTAEDWLLASKNICQNLILEYKRVDVLGVSLGGLLALNLSQCFTLNHLYLLAPALKLHWKLNHLIRLTRILKYLGFKNFRNMAGNIENKARAEIAYRTLPLKIILEILQFIQDHPWFPPSCSVDLFLGLTDQVIASKQVEALFSSLSNAKIHWLNNSAHVLPLDNDLSQIINCINQG